MSGRRAASVGACSAKRRASPAPPTALELTIVPFHHPPGTGEAFIPTSAPAFADAKTPSNECAIGARSARATWDDEDEEEEDDDDASTRRSTFAATTGRRATRSLAPFAPSAPPSMRDLPATTAAP